VPKYRKALIRQPPGTTADAPCLHFSLTSIYTKNW
jgi:hypothetical protein